MAAEKNIKKFLSQTNPACGLKTDVYITAGSRAGNKGKAATT